MSETVLARVGPFGRPRRFALAASLLLLLSLLQLAYRYTLPTDGWSMYTEEIDGRLKADMNLVGAPSELQPGDALLAVGDRLLQDGDLTYIPPPPAWRAGQMISLWVDRDGSQRILELPVVSWTAAAMWRYQTRDPAVLTGTLGAMIFLVVGWFTFWRRPEAPSAQALLILSSAVGANAISNLVPIGVSVQFDRLALWSTGFFSYIIFGALIAPTMLLFALLFPRPKRVIERRPWLAFLPLIYGLLLLIYLAAGGRGEVGWLSTLAMLAVAIASLVHAGFTQRDAVSRAQLRWVISSLVLGLGLFMINFPVGFGWVAERWIGLLSVVASLGIVVIGLGLAVAVLRYRLYDIDVIIRKTLVYAALTSLLGLVYFASVISLQTLFGTLTNEQSPLALVISTLAIAALFNPLRRRVQGMVDRRFYRRRYDAVLTLEQFARTAQSEVELETLSTALLQVIHETMQPDQASLWLASSPEPK